MRFKVQRSPFRVSGVRTDEGFRKVGGVRFHGVGFQNK
jgi:hypothetical protein